MSARPDGYWPNARGDLVHPDNVRPIDRDMDAVVRRIHAFGSALSEQLWRFREHTLEDITEFAARVVESYSGRVGGRKGNIEIVSFDGRLRVNLAQAEQIAVGPEIAAARALIEECVERWSEDSGAQLRALVDQAFVAGPDGSLNLSHLLRLRRIEIDDDDWRTAQGAISDALRPAGRAEYVRLYRRAAASDPWEQVPLHLATARRPADADLSSPPDILERRVRSAIDAARIAGMREGLIMDVLRAAKRRPEGPVE